jgi:ribosomal protein S18 acetylase RimI-like enzyme/predicted transcriptional regulator
MATKYPKSAKTGDTGVDLVRSITHKSGAIFRPFENADIGIDAILELLTNKGEPSGDFVLVQIKSGQSYIRKGIFFLDSDKDHFESWSRYGVPVIGVVCDVSTGEARWGDISAHLQAHPETIEKGPYSIKAEHSYSVVGFPKFLEKFRRSTTHATAINITPNLLIRGWKTTDAIPTQALLAPIALDYPRIFYPWLSKKFIDAKTSKKVIEIDNAIVAFSMWEKKDNRNVKLQTFFVGSRYRGSSIGNHLLYHELRTWSEDAELERVHVTVASSKADLISYFRNFGFRVEGIAPNRYPRPAAELVMAKHFIRKTIRTPVELTILSNELRDKIWGLGGTAGTRFGVTADDFAFPVALPNVKVLPNNDEKTVSPRISVIDDKGDVVLRHDDEALMREFFPLRIHLKNKRYVLVPIYPTWVSAMLSPSGPHTPLKLRIDHVYYCYPKVSKLTKGDLVVFYETQTGGGRKAAIGSAVVQDVVIGTPANLFKAFSSLGIYTLPDIDAHTNNAGNAMAIKFALYEDFLTPVPLSQINKILGHPTKPQGLTPISRDGFEKIRDAGILP